MASPEEVVEEIEIDWSEPTGREIRASFANGPTVRFHTDDPGVLFLLEKQRNAQ